MKKLVRQRLEKFLEKHATSSHVLDIGSGGTTFRDYFPNRLTVDIDPARNPEIVADAAKMPFEDGKFDVVFAIEMLEHVPDPQSVVNEIRRVLAPGGKLVLTTRFTYPLHDAPGDYWRYTRPVLEMLFSEFNSVSIEAEAGAFGTIGILLERISLQSKVRGGKFTKSFILLASRMCNVFDGLLVTSYGDIQRSVIVPEIISSGYYLVAYK